MIPSVDKRGGVHAGCHMMTVGPGLELFREILEWTQGQGGGRQMEQRGRVLKTSRWKRWLRWSLGAWHFIPNVVRTLPKQKFWSKQLRVNEKNRGIYQGESERARLDRIRVEHSGVVGMRCWP